MHVEDNVLAAAGPPLVPDLCAGEAVREHHGHADGSLADLSQGSVVVLAEVGERVVVLGKETGSEREGLVNQTESELVRRPMHGGSLINETRSSGTHFS